MRTIFRAAVLVVAMALVAAACSSDSTTETSAPPTTTGSTGTGGTVRVGIGGSPDSLNPGNGVLSEAYTLYELMYDTPISIDLDGNYIPELATDWSVSADGLTWTMHLVDNATFHDGTPLTSADVKYTLELYRDTADFPFLPSYPDVFEAIETPDPTTVTIIISQPIGNFEPRMVFMYILPKHIWEAVDDPVAFENTEMIGSGSFKVVEYRQGEFTRLGANEAYWAGGPNVDEVIFQTIENGDARVQALINGSVDMITEFPNTAISSLESAANVDVAVGEPLAPELRDVFFNVVDPEACPEGGTCSGNPALRDVAVRRALAQAVDKQQIIDVAQLGLASPGLSLVPIGLGPWFASEVSDHMFDLDAANAILDTAGYEDQNGDGIRECLPDQGCDDLTLRFFFPTDIDTAPREADLIASWWKQIGVDLQIQGLDADTLTSVCCPTFDFDVILWGWGSDPDPGFLLGVTLCSEIDSGFSETGYCNPDYDALYDAQAVETDPARRLQIVHEMQQLLVDEVPYIIPYYPKATQAYRTDSFTGWLVGNTRLALDDPTSLNVVRPVG